jgi:hypothetical protein
MRLENLSEPGNLDNIKAGQRLRWVGTGPFRTWFGKSISWNGMLMGGSEAPAYGIPNYTDETGIYISEFAAPAPGVYRFSWYSCGESLDVPGHAKGLGFDDRTQHQIGVVTFTVPSPDIPTEQDFSGEFAYYCPASEPTYKALVAGRTGIPFDQVQIPKWLRDHCAFTFSTDNPLNAKQ